jgi:2-keto-4-pentenoate hydratase
VEEVLGAVAALQPAFEAPNSRFADYARAGEAQLQADNACCGRFVIGAPAITDWRALDLRTLQVHGRVIDANGCRLACTGDGSAVLGDPRDALAWLANELRALGLSLRAGDIVSTGTCMVPLEVQPGDTVQADFGPLGQLTVRFSA